LLKRYAHGFDSNCLLGKFTATDSAHVSTHRRRAAKKSAVALCATRAPFIKPIPLRCRTHAESTSAVTVPEQVRSDNARWRRLVMRKIELHVCRRSYCRDLRTSACMHRAKAVSVARKVICRSSFGSVPARKLVRVAALNEMAAVPSFTNVPAHDLLIFYWRIERMIASEQFLHNGCPERCGRPDGNVSRIGRPSKLPAQTATVCSLSKPTVQVSRNRCWFRLCRHAFFEASGERSETFGARRLSRKYQ